MLKSNLIPLIQKKQQQQRQRETTNTKKKRTEYIFYRERLHSPISQHLPNPLRNMQVLL